jgi:hypothetical protein
MERAHQGRKRGKSFSPKSKAVYHQKSPLRPGKKKCCLLSILALENPCENAICLKLNLTLPNILRDGDEISHEVEHG